MTLDQFLAQLEARHDKWVVLTYGAIRTVDRRACPITVFQDMSAASYWEVGEELGLGDEDIRLIVAAADGAPGSLRLRLLAACGMPVWTPRTRME